MDLEIEEEKKRFSSTELNVLEPRPHTDGVTVGSIFEVLDGRV